ncbi:MAG: hypothetical protein SF162_06440 [bacterium]|nr:hypothetical protein [bacterium]
MRYVCSECGTRSQDGNVWCQRVTCSARYLNTQFRAGDHFGEWVIVKPLRVMRTAALYEAMHGDQKVLLKVAHPGDDSFAEAIKWEAQKLHELYRRAANKKNYPVYLPRLVPPAANIDLHSDKAMPYGRLVYRERLCYFIVLEHIDGFFLRDLLDHNPHPTYNNAGWTALQLLSALKFLKDNLGIHHLNLNPELVYVRVDLAGVYFPVLLDLGLGQAVQRRIPAYDRIVANTPLDEAASIPVQFQDWLHRHCPLPYIAPELYQGSGDAQTELYGVGLIFYEMLAGHPAFELRIGAEEDLRAAIAEHRFKPLRHREDELHSIVNRALRTPHNQPYESFTHMATSLLKRFGDVPPEKRRESWWSRRNQQRVMIGALVVIVTLVLLAVPSIFGLIAV